MLNTKYTRTTITLPEELLFEIKKKALIEKKTIKDVVYEGLSNYVKKKSISPPITISSFIGAWGEGESGLKFVKRMRYGKEEKERERYIAKLWKKSF